MKIQYHPKNVCARAMTAEVEDGIVRDIKIIGGCGGNLQGICALAKGRPAGEIIALLKGIRCGAKDTSCPDQLAIALERAAGQEKSV